MKTFITVEDNIIKKLSFLVENDKYKSTLGTSIEVDYSKLIRYLTTNQLSTARTTTEDSFSENMIIGSYFNIDEYNNI